jgi:hypothetical protein
MNDEPNPPVPLIELVEAWEREEGAMNDKFEVIIREYPEVMYGMGTTYEIEVTVTSESSTDLDAARRYAIEKLHHAIALVESGDADE